MVEGLGFRVVGGWVFGVGGLGFVYVSMFRIVNGEWLFLSYAPEELHLHSFLMLSLIYLRMLNAPEEIMLHS